MALEVKEAFEGLTKPSIAIDLVMLRIEKGHMQVMCVKKSEDDMWHLPGTILRLGETPEDAIERITESKVNTGNTEFEQLYTIADNPFRDKRGHVISIVYYGIYRGNGDIGESGTDLKVINGDYDVQWMNAEKISGELRLVNKAGEIGSGMMYDHMDIVIDTLERIKGKLRYTDIAFKFVGEKFTLSELEEVYTVINQGYIPGFRRIIKVSVKGTGEMVKYNKHRPAELFIKDERAYTKGKLR